MARDRDSGCGARRDDHGGITRRDRPGRDRRARAGDPRVQPRPRRPGPRRRGGDRCPGGEGGGPRSARRRDRGVEGQHVHAGDPDDVLVAHPRGLEAAVRRDRGRAVAGGGRDRDRQDQPRRVRHGLVHGELGVRADAQPARHHPGARRVERWQRRRRRRRVQRRVARQRHRRVDPPTGGAVRRGRGQADVRLRQPLRTRCICKQSRPDRPVHHLGRPTPHWCST